RGGQPNDEGGAPRSALITNLPRRSPWLEDRLELLELAAHAAADLFAQLEHGGVADRVARMVAVLGTRDHAGAQQDAEVLGDVLLRGAERLLELADSGIAL